LNNQNTPASANWFPLGRVSRTRGLRGEFFLDSSIDRELAKGTLVRIGTAEYPLQSISHPKDRALLKLAGIDTIEAAEALRDAEVSVRREALGEAPMLDDLVGCTVIDAESGKEIGVVRSWQKNPGNDLLELESGMLVPFVPAFFPTIDIAAKRLMARLPAGLDEL
jgi:16S rRNA processing protein RimM